MTNDMLDANDLLRAAVAARREAQTAGKPLEDWYDVSQPVTEALPEVAEAEETQHVTLGYDTETIKAARDWVAARDEFAEFQSNSERPGSLAFLELLEELRTLHYEKTASYGGAADPFENVTASAKCGVEPWRRALCDLSDCVVRMQKYANGQPVDYENALIDAANWSLICLLKLREAKRA